MVITKSLIFQLLPDAFDWYYGVIIIVLFAINLQQQQQEQQQQQQQQQSILICKGFTFTREKTISGTTVIVVKQPIELS